MVIAANVDPRRPGVNSALTASGRGAYDGGMRQACIAVAALALALPARGLEVRLGGGCAVHVARHPGYEEPLDPAPVLFGSAGVEILSDVSGLVVDGAAGWAGGAADVQATFSFRHSLAVDWGVLEPFLQVGVGWAGRFSGELTQTALFPEAAAGIEAGKGPVTAQLLACYRPVPLPLFEAEEYPLRRLALAARLRWALPQRGRSGLRGRR